MNNKLLEQYLESIGYHINKEKFKVTLKINGVIKRFGAITTNIADKIYFVGYGLPLCCIDISEIKDIDYCNSNKFHYTIKVFFGVDDYFTIERN